MNKTLQFVIAFLSIAGLSMMSFTAHAQCNRSPIITCPPNYMGCPGDAIHPDMLGYATAQPGDEGCPQPVISYYDEVAQDDPCGDFKMVKRYWRADYPNNSYPLLYAECTQIIILEDNNVPIISNCPSNINLSSSGSNCDAIATWTAPSVSDDCGVMTFSSNYNSGDAFPPGTTTVTYTATDFCGRSAQCSFTVTVEENCCTDAPIITCPTEYNTCIGHTTDPMYAGQASAYFPSSTCGTPVVTYQDVIVGHGSCANASIIDRIWTASHPTIAGLTASCTQRIRLEDVVAPTFTSCPANMTVYTTGTSTRVFWDRAEAVDNCFISSLQPDIPSGSFFPIGTTTVTYTVIDGCGLIAQCSFAVTVIKEETCNDNPILTIPANYSACPGGSSDPSVTGTATASFTSTACGTPIVSYFDQSVSANCSNGQVIHRTWTATHSDNLNLSSSAVQIITLDDHVDPVFQSCPQDIVVNANNGCNAQVTWAAPTATDNCSTVQISSNYSSGTTFSTGTTLVTYTATDQCGNSSVCSFNVTVNGSCCTNAPIITCPADYSGCPNTSIDPSVTGQAQATFGTTSTCGTPVITYTDQIISTGNCTGARTIRRTWRASHSSNSNLVSTCDQIITLQDNNAPIFQSCPQDIVVNANNGCSAQVTWVAPTVTDNCSTVQISSNYSSGTTFSTGTTLVTYTATDQCGNSSVCSFNIIVQGSCCTSLPAINCPADYTGCPGSSIEPSVTGHAGAQFPADSYCGDPVITYTDQIISTGNCTGARTIRRTWRASHSSNSNLVSTCDQIITLEDTTPPVLTNCPGDVVLPSSQSQYHWANPTVTENCTYNLTSNIQSGYTFPIGNTTVTITATDFCGNSTSCSFVVTVQNNNPGSELIVDCPDDIIVECGEESIPLPVPVATTNCHLCQGGEIEGFVYMGSFNGNQYYCSKEDALWPDAKAECERQGGRLAIIETREENDFLAGILEVDAAYIGMSDHESEGDFRWVDGSRPQFTRWYPNQPNNYRGAQDYVELLRQGYWNDQYNHKALEYIMEIPCYTVTQTGGPDDIQGISGTTTISFEVEDLCGNIETCSYDVTVNSESSLTCPDDIYITTTKSSVKVQYDEPEFSSCCNVQASSRAREISGFIYMGYFRGSHYYCSLSPATWSTSNQVCRQNGGYLAVVDNAEENSFLASRLINQIAFIGITDQLQEGQYLTSLGRPATYFNWATGQPNNYNGSQHFVELDPSGYWNDNYGYYKREYIMEMPEGHTLELIDGLPSCADFPVGTTTVTYKATDACGNVEMCSFDVHVSQENDSGGHNYCQSSGERSGYGYIKEVQVENVLFKSGNNGGYHKFGEEYCVSEHAGNKIQLVLNPGFSHFTYYCYWHIYIDFNGDGDFNDSGELIGRAKSANTVTGNIPIPTHAINGRTRMRISMSLDGYPESPCSTHNYGEVEDYCIEILAPTSKAPGGKTRSTDGIIEMTSDSPETGAIEWKLRDQLTLSPNPAQNQIRIESKAGLSSVRIFSMAGQQIFSQLDGSQNIDVSNLASGIYLVKMMDQEGNEKSEKLIINR